MEYDSDQFNKNDVPENVTVKIFQRDIPPVKNLSTSLVAIFRNLFSKFPRSMDVVYSKKVISEIESTYRSNSDIVVILDHFDAFSNLYELKDLNIIYIAHNNESDFHYQKVFLIKINLFLIY